MASKAKVGENRGAKGDSPSKAKTRTNKGSSKESNDDSVSFDLTNPEDLLRKMEQLDLTEEETDDLLKRAYEVNRELKKQLELGRKVMDRQMSSSAKGSVFGHRRPGSNITTHPGHLPLRQQTRMASASQSGARKKTGSSTLARPVQSYSYHSYKPPTVTKKTKDK